MNVNHNHNNNEIFIANIFLSDFIMFPFKTYNFLISLSHHHHLIVLYLLIHVSLLLLFLFLLKEWRKYHNHEMMIKYFILSFSHSHSGFLNLFFLQAFNILYGKQLSLSLSFISLNHFLFRIEYLCIWDKYYKMLLLVCSSTIFSIPQSIVNREWGMELFSSLNHDAHHDDNNHGKILIVNG